MPLTLITGPANAAKAGAVLGAWREQAARAPVLVVPTRDDVAHYERELAGAGAILGGSVVTFGGLLARIAERTGGAGRRLGPLARRRAVAEAVAAAPLRALRASARSPGFAAAAQDMIAELERSMVTPRRLGAAARRVGGETGAHLGEAAAVYARYAAVLQRRGRVDDDLLAWRAVDGLRAAPARWGAAPVLLYGFDDLTPVQLDAVRTLAGPAGAPVTISLPFEPRAAFAARAAIAADLRESADRVVELPSLREHYAPAARDELHHLERSLFEPGAGRVAGGGAVRLLEAGGERAEMELVAAEALDLLRAGMPAESIAVVLRSPARAGELAARCLSAYGVPHFIERPVALGATAVGRGVLALVRCALREDADAAELVAYLRTPGRLRRPELADRLEAAVRRRGPATAAQARQEWERANPRLPLAELDRLAAAARSGEGALLRALGHESMRLFAAPRRGLAPVLEGAELPEARALGALQRGLRELAETARAGPAEVDLLPGLLAGIEVACESPPARGSVLVTGPLGIRARRFAAVVVCGLQDGEFPRPAPPDPFLGDEERRALAGAGLRLRPRPGIADEERYLFYAVVSRARERLVLSCRTADEDGGPALPSPFLDDVRRLIDRGPAPDRRRAVGEVTWPAELAPTRHEAARAAALAAPRAPLPPRGPLAGTAAREALRHRAVVSAGGLEAYAACPVRWLVERELQPRRIDPDPEPLSRGARAHRVLERTLAGLRERTGSARVTPQSLPAARDILAGAVREEGASGPGGAAAAAALRSLERDLLRHLEHSAAADGPYEPRFLELAFGISGDGLPALELTGPDGGWAQVCGVIDRVDVDRDGARAIVRDYKTGRARADWAGARWERAPRLQVALYMLAVRRLLGLRVVGGLYQPLRAARPADRRARGLLVGDQAGVPAAGRVERDLVSEPELEAVLAAVEAEAVRLAGGLRAGRIAPCPSTCTPQGECAHPGVCRSPQA